ncbi:MAG: ATP-binding protein, partial [Anaerolineales bacterium]
MADQPIHKARAELSRLTALIDALTIGVFMVDTDGMVTEFNHHLANILHVGEDEFVGKPYQELFARLLEDSAEQEVVQSSLADAVIAVAERPVVDVVLASEPVRHLETSFFPVWEDEGAPIGWGGLLSDVTAERERVAWKLELLSILSHDIRAPLATLKGHATAVLSNFRMWDDAMVMEFLQTISRSTDQVIKQVDRNLALTRVESGRLGLRPEACSPEILIEQAVERAAAVMEEKEVRVSVPPDAPKVRADPGRIEELLINLLENAARYSPEDKPIEINADSEQRRVRFSVVDHGPGVPADRQKEIFRKHVQGGDADQTGGLGLYISRKIAEAHGGKLWVESPLENSDHGSRFVFALPEMPHIASRASASTDQELRAAVQAEQAPLRVLIIEDEVDFQALIRSMLLEAGFEVEMAQDGSTAIDIVQTSPPDL